MPTHIPVYQRKVNYETGEELFDSNGVPEMELVRYIIIPDPPMSIDLPVESTEPQTVLESFDAITPDNILT